MLDVKRLVSEVAARNGIRIDEDDPAFCIVTLNQLVLEESVTKVAEEIRDASRDFEKTIQRVHTRTGILLGQQVKHCLVEAQQLFARNEADRKKQLPARSERIRWISIGLFSAVLSFVAGMIAGNAFR